MDWEMIKAGLLFVGGIWACFVVLAIIGCGMVWRDRGGRG